MNEDELLEEIRSTGPLDSTDDAREALEAVMETLGERITDGRAEDLAAALPDVAGDPLRNADADEAAEFSTEEFLERVLSRADVDAEPLPVSRAVAAGVEAAAGEDELERAREQLPGEFDYIFEPGHPMDEDEFLDRVAERLPEGVDPRDATRATLRTLGERITGGEAVDLSTYLPREIRDPLLDAGEDATEFDREEFLEHVAYRAEIDEDRALDAARAVVQAIRETASESEIENVSAQLPADFDPLFDEGSG